MTIDQKPKHPRSEARDPSPRSSSIESTTPIRLMRIRQVQELVGLKKATIYKLHGAGQFPHNVKITARAVGWVKEEVQRWLAERRDRRS